MRMVHPLSRAVYEDQADGMVLVTEEDGRQGRFQPDGRHIDGEVLVADPHILDWVGGRKPTMAQAGRLRLEKPAPLETPAVD